MFLLHILILPAIVLILSMLLQNWLNKDEFLSYFKYYSIGVLSGILQIIFLLFINKYFNDSANLMTVIIKSVVSDGIVKTCFIFTGLFLIFNNKLNHKLSENWSLASIISFSYIFGIFTVNNIFESLTNIYPNYPIYYLSYIPLLLFISIFTGLGFYNLSMMFNIYLRIIWCFFIVLAAIASFASFSFLYFYHYIYFYAFSVLFIIIYIIFEFNDFRHFRS